MKQVKKYKLIRGGNMNFTQNLQQALSLGYLIEGNLVAVNTNTGVEYSILTYSTE